MAVDKTFVPKGNQVNNANWILIDANDQVLGRLATQAAHYLMGKHKPTYTPGVGMGDFVVVVNVQKLRLTTKHTESKIYYRHSGYPGGIKSINLRDQLQKHPDRVIRAAVWGMLPHNKLGRELIKRLKVYGGSEHPHAAQHPAPFA
jgi:large subunit ribosomal protein L13